MKLSKNFNLNEFLKSATADRLNISEQYNPPKNVVDNLKALVENVLQPLRNGLGKSIKVTSGYRSQAVNRAISGSASNSQHTLGQAADIRISSGSNIDIVREILSLNLPFDQLIIEFGTFENPRWIHVSFKDDKKNRFQILRATKGANRRTIYTRLNNKNVANSLNVKVGEKKMIKNVNVGKTTGVILLAVPFLIAAYYKLRPN